MLMGGPLNPIAAYLFPGETLPLEAYRVPAKQVAWEVIPPLLDRASPLRTSHLRDPLGPELIFASECFIDELAAAAAAAATPARCAACAHASASSRRTGHTHSTSTLLHTAGPLPGAGSRPRTLARVAQPRARAGQPRLLAAPGTTLGPDQAGRAPLCQGRPQI